MIVMRSTPTALIRATLISTPAPLPASWRVLYRQADGQFVPVEDPSRYAIEKDTFNQLEFETVTTTAVKMRVRLQKDWSAGIPEVVIG